MNLIIYNPKTGYITGRAMCPSWQAANNLPGLAIREATGDEGQRPEMSMKVNLSDPSGDLVALNTEELALMEGAVMNFPVIPL